MLKEFKNNPDYRINLKGNCIYKDIHVILPNEYGLVKILIDDDIFHLDINWLSLYCHYEMNHLPENFKYIHFDVCNSELLRPDSGHVVRYDDEINKELGLLYGKFNYIPGFADFIINKNGNIVSLNTGKVLTERTNHYGYRVISIYNPDKCAWRNGLVHLLLAKTYIPNPDISKFHCVNHIDGDKLNNRLDNLEWTTSLENNEHAILNGLRNDNIPVIVRNILTGEITTFPSISKARKELNIPDLPIYSFKNNVFIPRLFLDKYEIQYTNENRTWHYMNDNIDHRNIDITYQAKCISTGTVTEYSNMLEMSKRLNIKYARLNRAINLNEIVAVDGYIVRMKSSNDWPTSFRTLGVTNLYKSKTFEVYKGNVLLHRLDSGRKLNIYLSSNNLPIMSRKMLNEIDKSGIMYHGYIIKA